MEYTIVERVRKKSTPTYKPLSTPRKEKQKFDKKGSKKSTEERIDGKKSLFLFDPNTLGLDSLMLLGFSKYTSRNIVKYTEKGGRFMAKDDLQKIYGLDTSLFEEIYPFIKIKPKKSSPKPQKRQESSIVIAKPDLKFNSININKADTIEFKKLKGIGSVYSRRIVKFRRSLGGYFSIDQIKDVWGISDSLFVSIKPYLSIDTSLIEKKNINLLDKDSLAKHPYIDWKKAKIITNYKKMHGDFESMADFEKMHGIDKGLLDTLNHYFVAQ